MISQCRYMVPSVLAAVGLIFPAVAVHVSHLVLMTKAGGSLKAPEALRCRCGRLPAHRTRKRDSHGVPMCQLAKLSGPARGVGAKHELRGRVSPKVSRHQAEKIDLEMAGPEALHDED